MLVARLILFTLILIGFSGNLYAAETDSIEIYINKNDDLKALRFAIAQSKVLFDNELYHAFCQNKIKQSKIYLRLNDSKKSISVLYNTLKIAEKQNLKFEQVLLLNEIAKNFELAQNRAKAIEYFKKGEVLSVTLPNDTLKAFIRQGLFSVYIKNNQAEKAKVYMNQIMETLRASGDSDQQHRAYSNYSVYYFSIKEFEKGKKYLDSALVLAQIKKKKQYLNVCYGNLGYYYMVVEKDFKKGEQQYLKMQALNANDPYSLNNADSYLNLSYAYEQMEDFKKANECLNKYIEYTAVISKNRMNKNLRDADFKYAVDNVEKEFQQKQLALEQIQSKKQKIYIVIIALLMVIAILFYFFNQNNRLKEINKLKDIQSKLQQKIINATIDGQENERKKIASVLHDSISAQLSSAGLHLSAFSALNNSSSDEIAKTREIIKAAHDQVRDLSHELLPTLLAKFGILYALQDLCEKNSNSVINFEYQSDIPIRKRFPEEFEMKMYFIICELINNVVKHSGADAAQLKISENGDTLDIAVNDNGKGFKSTKSRSLEGFGLTQIRARIANMNGKFTVNSAPGQGTKISIIIPIPK